MPRATAHPSPSVALVYDWATTAYGGAESVLQCLLEAFPEAPLFTSVFAPDKVKWVQSNRVKTSWLQHLPFSQHHRALAPLYPLAFESLDLSGFDIVLSVSSSFAKGVLTKPEQLHVNYLLSPPRFLYSHLHSYASETVRKIAAPFFQYLTAWDQMAMQRPDKVIALSQLCADRMKETYGRKADSVLYPPLVLPSKTSNSDSLPDFPARFCLVVSRLVAYKRIDLAITACQQLNIPLVIIGEGPEENHLRDLASSTPELIHFWGQQSEAVVDNAYQRASAVLMPGLEDFGLTAIRAIWAGTPVLLHKQSGAAELLSTKSARLIDTETTQAVVHALEEILSGHFDTMELKQGGLECRPDYFATHVQSLLEEWWKPFERMT
jgi:glycosyltransferase involved in cell wall biosynthesis